MIVTDEDPIARADALGHAYDLGTAARNNGSSVGTCPFDPESELEEYEAWMDGFGEDHVG